MQQPPRREIRQLLRERKQRAWLDMALRYGKTFRFQGLVVTCEPRLVEELHMRRVHTQHCPLPHRFINRVTPGSNGVLFMDGERWLRHSRPIMPALTR